MVTAVVFCLLTGVFWTFLAIAISLSADKDFDLPAYGLLQTSLTAVFAFVAYAEPSRCELRGTLIVCALVLTGAFVNSWTQIVIKKLMVSGNHGPVWTLAQASLAVPFVVGVVFWHDKGTVTQWIGTALITAGVLSVARGSGTGKGFHWLSLVPFVLVGLIQSMYAIPSRLEGVLGGVADAGNLRPALASFGGALGWLSVVLLRKSPCRWTRKLVILAVLMGISQTISLKLFFVSLDKMTSCGLGNASIPLIVGTNIFLFTGYRYIRCSERMKRLETVGIILILLGILSISLTCAL